MNKQILEALMMRYQAQKVEAIVNLNTYLTAAVGVGEHPNIVEECDKLVKQIATANEGLETLAVLFTKPEDNQNG